MKSYTKSQLAQMAGVSLRTFSRWTREHAAELRAVGMTRHTHILPPKAVKFICDFYGINPDDP